VKELANMGIQRHILNAIVGELTDEQYEVAMEMMWEDVRAHDKIKIVDIIETGILCAKLAKREVK
jgi:acid phosphatase family membrane protein YuiD